MFQRWHAALGMAAYCLVWATPGLASGAEWTGAGTDNNWTNGANWLTGSAPPASADVTITAMRRYLTSLNDYVTINSLTIDGKYHEINSPVVATLTIDSGGLITYGDDARFGSFMPITLGAAQTWTINGSHVGSDSDYGELRVDGSIYGTSLTKAGGGRLFLAAANSLNGTFSLTQGLLRLGHDSALGTATLAIRDSGFGSTIESWGGDRTIANTLAVATDFNLNTNLGALTFTGGVTLAASPVVSITGPSPVTITGAVSETGGSQMITLTGSGTLYLQGLLNTTGGAKVTNGRLLLDPNALPLSGALISTSTGYIGTTLGEGVQSGFLDRFDKAATDGSIGFDGGNLIPSINLTGFSPSVRLGSSTTATLGGTITPPGLTYGFGGGGGTLKVSSSLSDPVGATRNVVLRSDPGQALTLILDGTNSYSNGTSIQDSALRFTNAEAVPVSGSITTNNRAYIGFDYLNDLSAFRSRLSQSAASNTIVGYDNPIPTTPLVVSGAIDLSAYPDDFLNGIFTYLGTSSDLTLTGTLTPAGPATESWRFAAAKTGHLTVASALTGVRGVIINLPNDFSGDYDKNTGQFMGLNSTVTLTGDNSYTGSTTLQGGRLELGRANALGTGTLTAYSSTLAVTTGGLTIANPIVNSSYGNNDGFHLDASDAAHSFTLSGTITGGGTLYKEGTGTVTLGGSVDLPNIGGDVGTYYSDVEVRGGTLNIGNTFSAGGELNLYDGTTVNLAPGVAANVGSLLTDNAPGGTGTVNLGTGSVLTIDTSAANNDPYFSGTISGNGSLVKAGAGTQYLGTLPGPSASDYSGGTTITDGAIFALSNGALGTGPVVINTSNPFQSGLGIYTGVTLTNALTFTSGTLAGYGTFAPSNGAITVGPSCYVWPGNLFSTDPTGTLTFATGLTLASGGTYTWEIQTAAGTPGVSSDLIAVTGTLTITSTPASPFFLEINSLTNGPTGFNNTVPYSWTLATASGGITGFDANAFSLTVAGFSSLGGGTLFLSQSGNDLLLNFTPVPEPSTWALLGVGLLGLLARGIRRRRG